MKKDHSQMSLKEAIEWAEKNTRHDDVCKRLASRAACRLLLRALCILQAENVRLRDQFVIRAK